MSLDVCEPLFIAAAILSASPHSTVCPLCFCLVYPTAGDAVNWEQFTVFRAFKK